MATAIDGGDLYESTLGLVPSFVYTSQEVDPTGYAPVLSGSPLGVPLPDTMPNEFPTTNASAPGVYASNKAGQPAHAQPMFWYVAFLIVGVILLSHVASLSLKGLG